MSKNGLYDFVQDTQTRNFDRQIYLIEDNAGAHKKIARLLKTERKKRDIVKIDWIPNSSDLYSIENVWGSLCVYLESTFDELNKSSDAVKEQAREAIRKIWKSEHLHFKICEAVERWSNKLRECSKQDGKNHFKG